MRELIEACQPITGFWLLCMLVGLVSILLGGAFVAWGIGSSLYRVMAPHFKGWLVKKPERCSCIRKDGDVFLRDWKCKSPECIAERRGVNA